MAKASYVPDRGDLIWLPFDPQRGREQAGRRPGLVLSPKLYNERAGLAIVCPITSKVKGYPYEIALDEADVLEGAILVDQVRCVDWRERGAKFAGKASSSTVEVARARLRTLI